MPGRRPRPRPLSRRPPIASFKHAFVLFMCVFVLVSTAEARAYPNGWKQEADCIHRHESTDWHKRTSWTGAPSPDHGGFQIDVRTWAAFQPRRWPTDPADASPAQQTLVAWRIYVANGRRWGHGLMGWQWPLSSRACGLE